MDDRHLLHGTGRVPSSVPTGYLEERREVLSSIKRFQSAQARENKKPSLDSTPRTQSVIVHSSRQVAEKPKAPIVYGANVNLQRIDEKFRTRSDDARTTVITATRKYDDGDDLFAVDCDELTRMIEDGPLKFRIVVMIVALFMVVASLIDYNAQSSYNNYGGGGMTPMFLPISIYVWVFSAFIITLEIKPFRMGTSAFHKLVLDQMNILRFT